MRYMENTHRIKSVLKSLIPEQIRPWIIDQYHAMKALLACQLMRHRKKPFVFNGDEFRYFSHHYNHTYFNERAVEIPIVLCYLEMFRGKRILEVGNVMAHYYNMPHVVVDKYEVAENVVNVDIIDYVPVAKFDLVISVSTFEHIGFDEYNRYAKQGGMGDERRNLLLAVDAAKSLLAPGGQFLLTVPLGCNPFLDDQITRGGLGMTDMWFLKRISRRNEWKQVSFEEVRCIEYGTPFGPGANGLVVARYVRPK